MITKKQQKLQPMITAMNGLEKRARAKGMKRMPWRKRDDLRKSMWLQIRITPRMNDELQKLADKFNCDSRSYFVRRFIDAITSYDVKEIASFMADIEEKVSGQKKFKL